MTALSPEMQALGAVAVGVVGWIVGSWIERGYHAASERGSRLIGLVLVAVCAGVAGWMWSDDLVAAGLPRWAGSAAAVVVPLGFVAVTAARLWRIPE